MLEGWGLSKIIGRAACLVANQSPDLLNTTIQTTVSYFMLFCVQRVLIYYDWVIVILMGVPQGVCAKPHSRPGNDVMQQPKLGVAVLHRICTAELLNA